MAPRKPSDLPEVFTPPDPRWASRQVASGKLRRLGPRLYTSNLDEPAEQLLRRRWDTVAAVYFPGAVITDRSAILGGPAVDGSLFLDVGADRKNPRPYELPGLSLVPRTGPGPIEGDMPFGALFMASPARAVLENLRPSRARSRVRRTLTQVELEHYLDRLARTRGDDALNELRDTSRARASALHAEHEWTQLDRLIGAFLGTRQAAVLTAPGKARRDGAAYDTARLAMFETLRAELAKAPLAERPAPPDPLRLLSFYEAYFSNWIEGTEFEVGEAESIVFQQLIPADRPEDAHDVRGTFEAVIGNRTRTAAPSSADDLEDYLKAAHALVMAGRPLMAPGTYKQQPNRAGMTTFVAPNLVRGTLREGYETLSKLPAGLPRAIFAMFMVAEIHPFTDGNGRTARLLMNAELTSSGLARIVIPLVYRDEYLTSLRALSLNGKPAPICKVLDRAQRWVSSVDWRDRDGLGIAMQRTNALVTPQEAAARNLHLLDDAPVQG